MAQSTVRWYGPQVAQRARELMKRRLVRAGAFVVRKTQRNLATKGPPPSVPGEFPHKVTGELQGSVGLRFDRRSLSISIIATAPHAGVMERRRSFLRRTLRESRAELRSIILGNSGGTGRYKFT